MKRAFLILLMLVLVTANGVYAADNGFTETRPDFIITTPHGEFKIDTGNNLMIANKFKMNLNKISSNLNAGTDLASMKYFSPSDMIYSPHRNSVFILGSSLDRSHKPVELYKDTMTYIGMNYSIVMEYDFDLADVVFRYSIPGSGVYQADYSTTWYDVEEDDWPIETYDWSKWVIQPKLVKSVDKESMWLLLQMPFSKEQRDMYPKLPSDWMLMQLHKFDLNKMEIVHYCFFNAELFESKIRKVPEATKYKDYIFNPAGMFLYESKRGYVNVGNIKGDLGVGFEMRLEYYGNPLLTTIYWK